MTRESRTIALAGLTLFVFALIGFLKDGSLIFPFPINPFIYFFVSSQFLIWHYKKGGLPALFVLSALLGLLGTKFFWEIFLSHQEMEVFYGYTYVDWFLILSQFLLIIAGISFIRRHSHAFYRIIFASGLIIQSYGVVTDDRQIHLIGLLVLLLINSLKPVLQPFQWIWTLLFVLKLSEWLSYTLI